MHLILNEVRKNYFHNGVIFFFFLCAKVENGKLIHFPNWELLGKFQCWKHIGGCYMGPFGQGFKNRLWVQVNLADST